MKKKLFLSMTLAILMVVCLCIAACGDDNHVHTFASEWSHDDTHCEKGHGSLFPVTFF